MNLKRFSKVLTIGLVSISFMITNITFAMANPPALKAKSAILIEAATGKVLYSKNAEELRYPASTTKIMSLIVGLEDGNLDDIITVSNHAASTEGSSLALTPGENIKMIDLLYGIMLISGNDATVALAEHIAGSVEKFSQRMTEKAHAIGAKDTHFTNSSGLPDPNHYTTAHDLARIAAYGYKNPLFAEIVSTKHKIIPWPGKEYNRELFNENRMLWLYEGGNGVKTGYTDAAGRCLVSGAKQKDIQLIAVVLDSDTMWDDSIALLNYGFSQVTPEKIIHQNDILKTIRVANGKSSQVKLVTNTAVVVPVSEEDIGEFTTVVDTPSKIEAPVIKGQKVGILRVLYKDKEITTVDLVADDDIERKSLFGILFDSIYNFFDLVLKKMGRVG